MKIAICGKMASGKTTLADYLCKNYEFTKFSLAGPVKSLSRFLFDIPQDEKNREIFQRVGDGARNHLFDDIWIQTLDQQVSLYEKNNKGAHIVVDDVRYENEALYLSHNGWKIIKIEIAEPLQIERIKNTYPHNWESHIQARTHASEVSLDEIDNLWFDYVIKAENSSKIFTLLDQIIVDNNLSNHQ